MYDICSNNSNINNFCKSQTEKEKVNSIKNNLIISGKYDLYHKKRYAEYSKYLASIGVGEINHKYEPYLSVDNLLTAEEEKFCKQIYDAQRKRLERLRSKLRQRIEHYNCLWLTLTFRDDVLDNTCKQTRRDYIRKYLKSLGIPFGVANIDYGDKDKNPDSLEREHYHAIIQADRVEPSTYPYGFCKIKKISTENRSVEKITEYINKLTNHAYKDSTTGRDRLIYLRCNEQHYNSVIVPTFEECPF